MKKLPVILLILTLFSAIHATSQDYRLLLANRTIHANTENNELELSAQIKSLPSYQGSYYGLIQFNVIPDENEVIQLKEVGIELFDYFPNFAFYAKINSELQIKEYKNIRRVIKLESNDKLRLDLSQKKYPEHAIQDNNIKLQIQAISPNDLGLLAFEIENRLGQVITIDKYTHVLNAVLPISELGNISELAFIQFITPIDAPGEPENFKGRNSHRIGALTQFHTGLSKELNGEGMNVMLQDDGVIGPHIDYEGRIGAQFITINRGDHGDHTGGTIMGAGNLEPRYMGMAPASQLWVYGAAYEGYPGFDSIYSHYNKHDIRITSTSYSNGVNAGYTALAQKLDDQVERMADLTHVFSAGNSRSASSNGWYTITGGHKVAKNVITVANLDYLDNDATSSSQGPTQDGRIKPDIGAVGSNVMSTSNPNLYVPKSGTSMSCPGVAGTVTVLYQAFKELNSSTTPNSALMKGIVCNTADDIGRKGPDFTNGFGRINALKAYDAIKNKTYFKGSVSTGASQNYTINVGANDRLLKVMLVWIDPQGTAGSSRPLINDVDLEVSTGFLPPSKPLILDPSNPVLLAQEGRDSINNIEQVVVENPTAGAYNIKVTGKLVAKGPQEFYVVYIIENDDIVVEYPVGGETLVPIEKEVIRWSDAGNTGPYTIEYSLDNGSNWNLIANVGANSRFYEWTVPNNPSSKTLVRVIGSSKTGISPKTFSIFKVPQKPNVDYACPDSIGLKWAAIDSANRYVIYKLGKKYMDSIGTTSNSEYNLLGSCLAYQDGWFAVAARGKNGEIGRRSEAYYFDGQEKNCILKNDIQLVKFEPELNQVSSCVNPNGVKIGVEVKNNSGTASSPFTLNLKLNNGTVVQENVNIAIAAGTSSVFYFNNRVTLNKGGNSIQVWQSSSSDQNSCNDSLFTNSNFEDEVASPVCTNTTFQNFNNCETTSNCESESCALIDNWYNAQNGVEDDIDWRVHNGSTPTRNTGPTRDHSSNANSGKYIYLEASGGCSEMEAKLITPCYDLTTAIVPKLSFWFHMYGNNMGSLKLDVFVDSSWHTDIMTPLVGNKGNSWIEQKVDLSNYKGKMVKLRFRGITGSDYLSDIALDDIIVTDTVVADFTTAQNSGQTVDFTNQSAGSGINTWDFGDGNTSSDYSPSHSYSNGGTYNVQLIIAGNCGRDTITKTIEVATTSVSELVQQLNQVKVFPQPANDNISIESTVEIESFRILDLSGKQVLSKYINSKTTIVQVGNLESGIYILELSANDNIVRKKIEILK